MGHLDCLRYAHENGCPWDDKACTCAALRGRLECLRYAHQNGCAWTTYTCSNASARGQLACLQYAHQNGCPWDERTCWEASTRGHPECLRYALEQGCPFGFLQQDVHPSCVPVWYHHGVPIPDMYHEALRLHRREHIRRARRKLWCVIRLLGWYNETCHARYAPDGAGYREAEADFAKLNPNTAVDGPKSSAT